MSITEVEFRTLQNQMRRQRRWNIALGALVVVGGLMAATSARSVPAVIQAKKFEVVNDAGEVIVQMNSVVHEGTDYGFVTTRNNNGQILVVLGANTGGNGLVRTENGKGQTLVKLGATAGGTGLVRTQNGTGQTLVELGTSTSGAGLVKTQNGSGQALVELSSGPTGGIVQTKNDKDQITSRTF